MTASVLEKIGYLQHVGSHFIDVISLQLRYEWPETERKYDLVTPMSQHFVSGKAEVDEILEPTRLLESWWDTADAIKRRKFKLLNGVTMNRIR